MGDIIEAAKFLFFPEGVPYEIKGKEILQPNGCYIDHLLDMPDAEVNPLMHIMLTVGLNGRYDSDEPNEFYLNAVAEFLKNGELDFGLWNAKESKSRFRSQAEIIDLPLPSVAYWLLGHDMMDYLRQNEPIFKIYAQTDLIEQQAGKVPKREIDFELFKEQLAGYGALK